MPKKYEAIRDKLESKGVPEAQAKTSAAKIYNSQRGDHTPPVTGHLERAAPYSKRK